VPGAAVATAPDSRSGKIQDETFHGAFAADLVYTAKDLDPRFAIHVDFTVGYVEYPPKLTAVRYPLFHLRPNFGKTVAGRG
jgi:hypothetical protein